MCLISFSNIPNQAREATIAMPYKIQRIDEFIQQLDAGDLKLRVRVLEVCQKMSGRFYPLKWWFLQDIPSGLDISTITEYLIFIFQAERAARRATVMQMATIHTVLASTLLNVGVTLTAQGVENFATVSYIGAGRFGIPINIPVERSWWNKHRICSVISQVIY